MAYLSTPYSQVSILRFKSMHRTSGAFFFIFYFLKFLVISNIPPWLLSIRKVYHLIPPDQVLVGRVLYGRKHLSPKNLNAARTKHIF